MRTTMPAMANSLVRVVLSIGSGFSGSTMARILDVAIRTGNAVR